MGSEGEIVTRERLRMKRKRGVIPLWAWNALVEVVYSGLVVSGVGCRIIRNKAGTAIEVPRRPWVPTGNAATVSHPFRMVPSLDQEGSPELAIEFGQITLWSMHKHATDDVPILQAVPQHFLVAGGFPYDNPQGNTPIGKLALDDGKTYGIWLRGKRAMGVGTTLKSGFGYGYTQIDTTNADDWQVLASYTATTQDSKTTEADYAWYFIGQASIEDGEWDIKQYLRSDLQVPFGTLPVVDVSLDADNALTMSTTDGKMYYSET